MILKLNVINPKLQLRLYRNNVPTSNNVFTFKGSHQNIESVSTSQYIDLAHKMMTS